MVGDASRGAISRRTLPPVLAGVGPATAR